ncbi:MAG: D-alanyl-D-alanine carboxypeptidase [Candidatus Aureabacteria bacterium]|nr:D-alanyl-D-alanine carboxypeptidase [Candidatus Auribacterota bacterium]
MNRFTRDLAILIAVSCAIITPAVAKKGASTGGGGRAKIPARTGSPYLGAIAVNADTGEVLFEENADAECYPASIIKLMDMLIIQEKIEAGTLKLDEQVSVNAQVSKIGGSQVYLKEGESFPVQDLIYAIMVQSANDAAMALALHVGGSVEGFVQMMQERADALGMKNTRFHTVHGLPPGQGQEPDVSTPRDMVILARELLKHPDILKYTSTLTKGFRNDTMIMQNHNKLLGTFDGCDGLKTGYFRLGGYSVVATAQRAGNRFIAAVGGSKEKLVRNAKARELLSKAFAKAPSKQVTPVLMKESGTPHPEVDASRTGVPGAKTDSGVRMGTRILLTLIVILLIGASFRLGRRSRGGPPQLPGVHYGFKK